MVGRIVKWSLVAVAAALVVAAGVAFRFQDDIAYRMLAPNMHYADMDIIPRPVYLFAESWASRPDKDNLATLVPAGVDAPTDRIPPADVFFIHPSTYFGENWNADARDPASEAIVDGLIMASQASAFNACCRIFAPRYRQAHVAAFVRPSADGHKAIDLAYVDVVRAFEHYLVNWNEGGRPFIIAGHSQGAVLAMRLLTNLLDGEPHRKNLVGAYIIGAGVPMDRFESDWETIAPCETATDTGCVVSWETYVDGADPRATPNIQEVWYNRHWAFLSEEERNCTNPVSWSREPGRTEADQHLGALPVGPGVATGWGLVLSGTPEIDPGRYAAIPAPIPGLTWAECRDGFLFVEAPEQPVFQTSIFGDGNLHVYDLALFYMNIRQNAQDRVDAFLQARQ